MNKKTLEQFGADVRWKYPQYAKFSNEEIAQRVLAKYPQYAASISDLPTQEKKSVGRKIGDFFTSGTQQFGTSIGQIFAGEKTIDTLSAAEKRTSDTELSLVKKIRENKQQGKDTSRLERSLSELQGRGGITQQVSKITPAVYKSDKQIIGEAVATGAEALSGGIVSGVKGIGLSRVAPTAAAQATSKAQFLAKPLSGRLAQIGKETVKNAAQIVPFGYALDVAQNLMQDKSGASIFKPGIGTAVSALIPLSIGGVQAGRHVASTALSKSIAPNLSGVPSGAYDRLRTGKTKDLLGKVTPEQALDDARASASAFKSAMYKQFGKGKEQIINEFTGQRIGLTEKTTQKLTKIAERFGFDDMLPQNPQNMSAKETIDLLTEINAKKRTLVLEFDDPLVKSMKQNLLEIKDELMKLATERFGGKGGSFEKLYKDYASKKAKIKDIQSIIGKVGVKPGAVRLTPVQHQTATRRLQKVFNDDANGYFDAIRILEEETGQNLLDKVAASQLSKIAPKSFRVGISSFPGAPAQGGVGIISDIISAVTFPFSSPRVGQWLIRKIGGYDASIASRLLNASPSVRTAIYNAVHKENMAFSDAVELYAKDYLKNPRMGLSIEDVSQKSSSAVPDKIPTKTKTTQGATNNAPSIKSNTSNIIKKSTTSKSKVQDIHPEDLATMNDFTEMVAGSYKPSAIQAHNLLEDVHRIAERYGFTLPKGGERAVSSKLGSILEQVGYKGRYAPPGASRKVPIKDLEKTKLGDRKTLRDKGGRWAGSTPSNVYKGEKDLTTKFLEYAKGKTTLSKQEILDFSRRPELKKGEADLLRKYGEQVDGKISAKDFADSIRRDLLELKPVKVKDPQYRNTTLGVREADERMARSAEVQRTEGYFEEAQQLEKEAYELQKGGKNYEEVIFESPITTNGSSHFPNSKNYFAHARGDEVVEGGKKIWREQEIQSDLLQKEGMENVSGKQFGLAGWRAKEGIDAGKSVFEDLGNGEIGKQVFTYEDVMTSKYNDFAVFDNARIKETSKLDPFTNDRFGERIMRERIREKAQKGYSKYRLPTGETIGKIEGLTGDVVWTTPENYSRYAATGGNQYLGDITPQNLKIGQEVIRAQEGSEGSWVVTDILGDGRFKAVPKDYYDEFQKVPNAYPLKLEPHKETFDLTGKSNPQYRRYEQWGKFLKNKYGGKVVTDPQGNSWVEIDLKKEMGKLPIEAFGVAPLFLGGKEEN